MNDHQRAAIAATGLRQDLGLPENSAVDLKKVTERLGIRVRKIDLGEEIEGVSKSKGNKHLVVLKPAPYSIQKERFTLAHEIGHILIHHGSHYCKTECFNTFSTQSDVEQEANAFAEELLLPKRVMLESLKNKDFSWRLICQIADNYIVSASAAAIRLVRLYDDDAIIVWHDGRHIKWQVRSEHCFWKLSTSEISNLSLFKLATAVNTVYRKLVDPQVWIDNEVEDLKCEEESVYFKTLQQYLTILKFYKD